MSSSISAALARVMSCVVLSAPCLPPVTCSAAAAAANKQWAFEAASPRRQPLTLQSRTSATGAAGVSKIAFASDRDGNFEIYVMDADGGGQTRLTENPGEDYQPAWSPEGTRLAFVSTRDGNAEIYVMNADGSGQTRLTNNTASDLSPKWAPNGSQIAFITNRVGNDEIYLMNADGSNQTDLTNNPADDASLSFSPNGLMIAFASTREDGLFHIYTMSADGNAVTRLTSVAGNDANPSWSPQQIAFQSDRDDSDEVYVMGINGSNQTRLTNNADFDIDPNQSSDGARIAFSTARDGNLEIYLMNPDGTGLTRLTTNSAADINPAVQPQGVSPPAPVPGAATIQFSSTDYSVTENQGAAALTVVRTGSTAAAATVDFATVNGTATNRTDYTYNFGTLRFAAGEASKTITLLITDDVFIESDETMTVTLRNPTGAALGSLNTATLTIISDDTAAPSVNPVDNARFFVNQHYADFLNRAPDPAGSDYWTNQITQCGNNLVCLNARRNSVSAAFFGETEFQITGFFVYRLHKGSFGTLPARQQFIMDRSRLVVGATLDADKAALANDFVGRDAFVAQYPTTLTPEAFVNKLFDTAALFPFTSERQQLATDIRNGKTRAQAVTQVIEIQQFKTQEFNPAFVFMQYVGYLGRDPDAAGFAFWLNVLNNKQPNNFLGMVCSFITSDEYQLRFSSKITQSNSTCSGVP